MKKICIVFSFCLFCLTSCDSGLKFENPNDPNNQSADSGDTKTETGELGGECYGNKTCNEGLICDKENNSCVTDPGNANDSDKTDTGTENGETTPSDTGDTTTPTTDPTTEPTSSPNPGCTPSCGGKECGSDGCGGVCGDYGGGCPAGFICNNSTNVCLCTPQCDNVTCNGDNGCGGTCGCKSGFVCNNETNLCECVPNCNGKECGDDDCGGTCGDCGEEGVCIESAHTCKYCTKITLSPITDLSKASTNRYYKTTKNAYTPNTGASTDDKYALSFTTSAITQGQVVDLAEFDSLNSCEDGQAKAALCFIIGEDHDGKGSNSKKVYFTKRGTLTIDEYDKSSDHIKFSLKDVKLGEIEETFEGIPAHAVRTFAPGGDCLVIENTTLSYE